MGDMKKLLENWREYETGALNELDGSGLGPKAKKTNWEKVSADRERQIDPPDRDFERWRQLIHLLHALHEGQRIGDDDDAEHDNAGH